MAVRPAAGKAFLLKGRFAFTARSVKGEEITDAFMLTIEVPHEFPMALPQVVETGERIPRTADFHLNSDGTLCLGSPLRLLLTLSQQPTLIGFAEKCLVPYLFAISRKLKDGGPLAFDELAHGSKGLLADYVDLFRLKNPEQADYALKLLGMKKRRANKLPCPCGCEIRLGRCRFNWRLRQFRSLASRSWFRAQAEKVRSGRKF